MPDDGLHEREVCSVKGCNLLASTEITSSLPNSWLPALYFACDEHAGNFQKGGRFSVDPRKGKIDLSFRGRLRPNSVVNYVGPIELEGSAHASPMEQASEIAGQIGPVYEPLREPSIQTIRIPHLELMQREEDRDIIVATAKFATEAMVAAMDAPEPLSQHLYRLQRCFAVLLGREPHGGAIVAGANIGYIIGEMENESGVEREGMSEQHYACALRCVMLNLPDDVTNSVYFGFIEDCGYYLARIGGLGLDDLRTIVRNEVQWLEQHG
jgi:hypothetical protein